MNVESTSGIGAQPTKRFGWFRGHSLVRYSLVRVLPLALAACVGIWAVAAWRIDSLLSADMDERLEHFAHHARDHTGRDIRDVRFDLVELASELSRFVGRDGSFSPAALREADKRLGQASLLGMAKPPLVVLDLDGRRVLGIPVPETMSVLADRLRAVMATPDPLVRSTAYVQGDAMVFGMPLIQGGKPRYWLAAVLDPAAIAAIFMPGNIDLSVLYAADGQLLYANGELNCTSNQLSSCDIGPFITRTGTIEGVDGLRFMIGERQAEILGPKRVIQDTLLAIIVLVMGTLTAAVYSVLRLIRRPLQELLNKISLRSQLPSDSLLESPLTVEGPAEIRELATTFNEASRTLVAQMREKLWLEVSMAKLSAEREMLAAVVEATTDAVIITDPLSAGDPIIYCNAAFTKITGYAYEEVIGHSTLLLVGPNTEIVRREMLKQAIREKRTAHVEITHYKKDGSPFVNDVTIFPILDESGETRYVVRIQRDVSERKNHEVEKMRIERRMADAAKMEALGTLAGGVAHEINTPTQYVGDNLHYLKDAFQALAAALAASKESWQDEPEVAEKMAKLDIDYHLDEAPAAIDQGLEGVERIAGIVDAVKQFAYPDPKEPVSFDLNKAVLTTLTVTRNQWKYVADAETDLDPATPLIVGHPGEINQVLLNIIVNAAHAIEDRSKESGNIDKGRIDISTRLLDDIVEIRIKDTGGGIPEEALPYIFDPFFTTKAPGKGTGQGLAISHTIVTRKHGGTIKASTIAGDGTIFTIRLPVEGCPVDAEGEPV